MAKSTSSRTRGATAPRARANKFRQAMDALEGVGVDKQEIGKLNRDGTVSIDSAKLEELKRTLGEAAWSRVRFVALNAPFNRRSPIRPA
jgi:hydrogenase maturation factor HypE